MSEEQKVNDDVIAKRLEELEAKSGQNEWIAKIVADPDVRQILEARQRGEQVTVQVGEPEQKQTATPEVEDPEDFDMLDNRELADYTMKKTTSAVSSLVEQKLNEALEKVMDKVQRLEGYVQTNETQTIRQQVSKLREKYSDFDDYRDVMVQINRENPSLSPEELYFVAKKRSGHFEEPGPKASSEKPTNTSSRPSKPQREQPLPPGRGGFDEMLGEALEELDVSKF